MNNQCLVNGYQNMFWCPFPYTDLIVLDRRILGWVKKDGLCARYVMERREQ